MTQLEPVVIAAFYKFVPLPDFEEMRYPLLAFCKKHDLKGTILLAHEGVNSTISGTREAVDALFAHLRSDARLADLEWKESYHDNQPFERMKVRLKKEIVRMGQETLDMNLVGKYVEPKEWDALISSPDVAVIDTRNDYEIGIGTFERAIDPKTKTFRQFPKWAENWAQDKLDGKTKVAMFCTGGIRCEKSTALLKEQGFEEVYHLKGGILNYLEKIPQEQSLWQGECYVFDNRVAVNHALEKGSFDLCHGCRHPITDADKQSALYEQGICCPRCHPTLTMEQRRRFEERQRQIELAKQRNDVHIGRAPTERQLRAKARQQAAD